MLKRSVIAFMFVLFLIGCGKNVSDWSVYSTASNQFIVLAEQYETYYQIQDEETKVKWKATFDPVFDKGDKALTDWRMVLNAGGDSLAQQQAFLSIKTQIISLLYEMIDE